MNQAAWPDKWSINLGEGYQVEIPLIKGDNGIYIYSFNLMGRAQWNRAAGTHLAAAIEKCGVEYDVLLTAESKSLALTHQICECLHLEKHATLRKDKKLYMRAPVFEFRSASVTTDHPQTYYMGSEDFSLLEGKKVGIVDDVLSTGGTASVFWELAKEIGFEITFLAVVLTEGERRSQYRDVPLITLDHIPFPGRLSD